MKHPWHQQPDEAEPWFTRFEHYRLLGPGRSLLAVYNAVRQQQGKAKAKSAPPTWSQAARTWQWEERAHEWDRSQLAALEQQQAQSQQDWESRRQDRRHRLWQIADQLMAKAQQMLDYPLEVQLLPARDLTLKEVQRVVGAERAEEVYALVQQGGAFIAIPGRWSLKDVTSYLTVASELGHQALGQAKMGELEAIKVLIDAGWFPDYVLDVAQQAMDDLGERLRGAIEGIALGHNESGPMRSSELAALDRYWRDHRPSL